MERVLGNIAASITPSPESPRLLVGTGKSEVHLLLVCTAERGLCGAFNSMIVRLARERANRLQSEGKTVKFICVGRKGYDQLRRQYDKQIAEVIDLKSVRQLAYENASEIAQKSSRVSMPANSTFARCSIRASSRWFHRFPPPSRFIPPVFESKDTGAGGAIYEYEPEEEEILADLLPRNLATQIFRALLENAASEQGARMSAMDNATRNAGDMIKKQTIIYNRTRQAMITKELIEIISGAEAL
jgi:F-type H+-transporting ATPase subunit gamma